MQAYSYILYKLGKHVKQTFIQNITKENNIYE